MLTWDVTKVKNYNEKIEGKDAFVHCLIMAAVSIGMKEITKDNVREWTRRIERCRSEGIFLFLTGNGPLKVEEKDIAEWIGLKTNVRKISNAAFDKRIRERLER